MDIFIIRANALVMWMCLFTHTHTHRQPMKRTRERFEGTSCFCYDLNERARAWKRGNHQCLQRDRMTLDIDESQFISLARCCYSSGERQLMVDESDSLSDPSGKLKGIDWSTISFTLSLSFRCSLFCCVSFPWSARRNTRWPSKKRRPSIRRSFDSLVHTNWSITSNRRFNWPTTANS